MSWSHNTCLKFYKKVYFDLVFICFLSSNAPLFYLSCFFRMTVMGFHGQKKGWYVKSFTCLWRSSRMLRRDSMARALLGAWKQCTVSWIFLNLWAQPCFWIGYVLQLVLFKLSLLPAVILDILWVYRFIFMFLYVLHHCQVASLFPIHRTRVQIRFPSGLKVKPVLMILLWSDVFDSYPLFVKEVA